MLSTAKLLAWTETAGGNEVTAAYVGGPAVSGAFGMSRRPPARTVHPSLESARAWIEKEAATIGLPIEWLPGPPPL